MNDHLRPKNLDGYPLFDKLTDWRRGGPPEQKRDWSVRYFRGTSQRDNVECYLTWRFGDNQLGGIRQIYPTPEEAVWAALQEFANWEMIYADNQPKGRNRG